MAHCYHHALSSVHKWGGSPEDYLPLHQWFDESKMLIADFRHRALRHHAEGIFMLERFFGATITVSTGRVVPVRLIGEQHVLEDLGHIPTFADWVRRIRPEPWMGRAQPLHKIVDPFAAAASEPSGTDHTQDPASRPTAGVQTARAIVVTSPPPGETSAPDTEALMLAHGGVWGEHPRHSVEAWLCAVGHGDTRSGYWNWVAARAEDQQDDDDG